MASTLTPRSQRDWTQIKADYVEGVEIDGELKWLSLAELAARHSVPQTGINERSSRESWTAERALFQRRMEHERQTKKATEVARLGSNLDLAALRVANNSLSIAAARINELGVKATERAKQLNANPDREPDTEAVDAMELDRLVRAANEAYELGTRAIGDVRRVQVDLDADIDVHVDVDDERSMGLIAILADIGKVTEEVTDVIDVGPGRLRLAAARDALSHLTETDTPDERVHTEVAHDGEPQPEADGVPAAG